VSSVRIQSEDFDPGAEMAALKNGQNEAGAVVSFVGLVRGDDGLNAMTLEHYAKFALREITDHVEQAKTRWPLLDVRVVHRTGRLTPGERIVFVGVSSAHRQAAFEAASFLMDYLKTRAPFWKLEERAGEERWVEERARDDESVKRWH